MKTKTIVFVFILLALLVSGCKGKGPDVSVAQPEYDFCVFQYSGDGDVLFMEVANDRTLGMASAWILYDEDGNTFAVLQGGIIQLRPYPAIDNPDMERDFCLQFVAGGE